MRRILRVLQTKLRVASGFAPIVALLGLVATGWLVGDFVNTVRSSSDGLLDRRAGALGFGIILLFILSLRSLVGGLLDTFFSEHRITAGVGLHDSSYNYLQVLDAQCEQVVVTGHNLSAALEAGLANGLLFVLERNKNATITIVCATYDAIRAVSEIGAVELISSIKRFQTMMTSLSDQQRRRFNIYFHPGAVSLSCLVRDPHKSKRALAVFTPRWGTDRIAERRLYCVIEKEEHRDLFEAITQGIKYPESERVSLEDTVKQLQAMKRL